ncbi:hypothetical protein DFH07DRAFT_808975 [Mycena maculata]|uniref:Major facilitator superfamily transporter n=1 Tax=Mycena maculata TaxID=230809 RepID=A0AAD7JNX1_9AGAR|nr:hypothetical protein DFH07DRAFT_808975 [Mycena maculata]
MSSTQLQISTLPILIKRVSSQALIRAYSPTKTMSAPTEDTPLLVRDVKSRGLFNPYRRVLVATFLLSTTFWFTATPIMYAYRIFNCQEYYADPSHPPYEGTGDACAITAVDTSTAKDISVMVILSTFSATVNLLFTTWQIRHWGLRTAIVQQTFWPAIRNLTQIYATFAGGRLGITIMQSTQLVTILGGGAGYMLSANSYIAEVVTPVERTAAFGVLAGVSMLGTAFGYIAGGLANDLINISAPFEITFCLLVASTFYTALLLPYIPPAGGSTTKDTDAPAEKESLFAFLTCLRVFLPVKYAERGGTFWGLTLLGAGAFGSVLATAYVPLMLQLTATNQYGYKASDNGFLMSSNSLARAIFLTFAFPRIIGTGRVWFARGARSAADTQEERRSNPESEVGTESGSVTPSATPTKSAGPGLPLDASAFEPASLASADGATEEPPLVPAGTDAAHGSGFDLAFLRWSMVIDALLTALVGFSSQSWHMMAAAAILPLASGTAPACKGVLMDMVPESRRTDALAGIALIETLALISTVSLFGSLFALLSDIGYPSFVFFCNAAVALVAAAMLFMIRFPRGRLRAT